VFPRDLETPIELLETIGEDAAMGKMMDTAWEECDLVEVVPGRCGGRPTIRGTRIEPGVILVEEEHGRTAEQTHESFPDLSVDAIRRLRSFAHDHQLTL
jgi:uncharacterized protein (DUF433 family)